MRSSALAGLLAALGVASALLAAEPERRSVRLVYQRSAERCPPQESVEQQVRSRLGYDPFSSTASTSVRVALKGAPGRWRAHIELLDAQNKATGERQLESFAGDCDELAASVAFAISIAVDPLAATRPAASSPPSAAPAASSAATPAASPAPSAPPAPLAPPSAASSSPPDTRPPPGIPSGNPAREAPTPRPSLQAQLGGFGFWGAAPSLAGGLALGLGARWPRASLSLEGRLQAPASTEASSGKRVSASVRSVTLAPCTHAGILMACVVGTLGVMNGEGSGVQTARRGSSLVTDLGGRFGLDAPLVAPLSLRVFGEVQAHLSSISLDLNGQSVWSSPTFGGGGGLSLVGSFW